MRWLVALGLVLAVLRPDWARAEGQVLTLGQAIALGQRRAPEIRQSLASARSEEAQYRLARAAYYPTLTATASGAAQTQRTATPEIDPRNGAVFIPTIVTNSLQGGLGISGQWTVYDFGRTAGAVANARGQLTAAVDTLHATEQTIVATVANAYMNAVYSEKSRDVALQTLRQREKLVTIARGLIAAGLQQPLEEIRAQARADASRRDLASAEGSLLDARAVLGALLALDPRAEFQLVWPQMPVPDETVEQAMQEAERLPSVSLALDGVDGKRGVLDTAASQYLPSVGVQAGASYQVARLDTLRDIASTGTASGLLTVTETLFDPTIAPALDAARYNLDDAQGVADQARRDAREEASRAVLAMGTARTMVAEARRAAEGAAEVLAIVQARYIQGLSSPIELITAEGADADARTLLIQDELTFALALVRVYVATGRAIDAR